MKKGIYFAFLAAFISGISIFYNKLIIVKGIDATIFNIIKNGSVALLLSTFIFSQSSRKSLSDLTKKQWTKLLIIALIGGSTAFILFFEGLKTIPAINATLIQKTLFIWVAILAIPILKEKLSLFQIVGYALILASNLFIGGFTGFSFTKAEGLVFAATLLWSLENVLAKNVMKNTNPHIVIWGRMFLGTLLLLGYALFTHRIGLISNVPLNQFLPIGGSVMLLSFYVLCWYKALSLAPATVVTSILILATPITNLLTGIFITHTIDFNLLIYTFLTLLGIGFIAFYSSKSPIYGHARTGSL